MIRADVIARVRRAGVRVSSADSLSGAAAAAVHGQLAGVDSERLLRSAAHRPFPAGWWVYLLFCICGSVWNVLLLVCLLCGQLIWLLHFVGRQRSDSEHICNGDLDALAHHF